MAPLIEAVAVKFVSELEGTSVYDAVVDPTWTVFSVPCGGYTLGIVVEACGQHQSSTSHKDPIHVTAHFLKAASIGPISVRIRTIKTGRSFTNLIAELEQDKSIRIMAHIMCGNLCDPSADSSIPRGLPSQFVRRFPFSSHPADVVPEPPLSLHWPVSFDATRGLLPSHDELVVNRRRVQSGGVGAGGIESGMWVELLGPQDRLTPAALTLLGDIFPPMPMTLAELVAEDGGQEFKLGSGWAPTLVLTIEFKAPIPAGSAASLFAPRTVAVYSKGVFLTGPQGRHDEYIEVWTAPAAIGKPAAVKDDNWRDKQICLATASQMMLWVSGDVRRQVHGAKHLSPAKL